MCRILFPLCLSVEMDILYANVQFVVFGMLERFNKIQAFTNIPNYHILEFTVNL